MSQPDSPSPSDKSGGKQMLETLLTVALAIAMALTIQAFLIKPYRVPSESMLPTLVIDQRVLVERIEARFGGPDLDAVVVFDSPQGALEGTLECADKKQGPGSQQMCGVLPTAPASGQAFIKRLVGLPGDRIQLRNGRLIRNGKPVKESYILPCSEQDICSFDKPVVVPPNSFYVLGDNRGNSYDSRFWGPVPRRYLIGEAFGTYWPPKRIGGL